MKRSESEEIILFNLYTSNKQGGADLLNGAEKGVGMIPNSHVGIETTISKKDEEEAASRPHTPTRLYLCTSFSLWSMAWRIERF
jgi:hypothetical protein